ncbi:Uncharacterised protein at_DN2628 [Pycnogonum litorale]
MHKFQDEKFFSIVYMNKTILAPRKSKLHGELIDIISRNDQRASGEVGTYAFNTLTNTKVQLIRAMESDGIFQNVNWEKRNPQFEDDVSMWLKNECGEWLERMAISGYDCMIRANNSKFGESVTVLNLMGKIRKDIPEWKASIGVHGFENVAFCSHHYHEIQSRKFGHLAVHCREES